MLSAGLLPFRFDQDELQVLVAHPGGPIWADRHLGAWSVVKGGVERGEEPFDAAIREFTEETGWAVRPADPIPLGEVTQRSGKRVIVWAFHSDFDTRALAGDLITMSWRGRVIRFPEIDEVRWCGHRTAAELLNPAQAVYYERLKTAIGHGDYPAGGGTLAS